MINDPNRSFLEFRSDDYKLLKIPNKTTNIPVDAIANSSLYNPEMPKYIVDLFDLYSGDNSILVRKSPNVPEQDQISLPEVSYPGLITSSSAHVSSANHSMISLNSTTATVTQRSFFENEEYSKNLKEPITIAEAEKIDVNFLESKNFDSYIINKRLNYFHLITKIDEALAATFMKSSSFLPLEGDASAHSSLLQNGPPGNGKKLMIECVNLNLTAGINEPLFLSMALYDLSPHAKCKISETFHFDFNSDKISALLANQSSISSASGNSKARYALFNISNPNPDIVLLVRVEKVLEGDMAQCADRLSSSTRSRPSSIQHIGDVCARLGNFRQPLCWSILPLFGSNATFDFANAVLSENSTVSLANNSNCSGSDVILKPLYRQESDKLSDSALISSLSSITGSNTLLDKGTIGRKSVTSTKKFKTIPGYIHLRLTEIPNGDNLQNTVNPSLVPYASDASKRSSDLPSTPIVREIQEFLPTAFKPQPYTSFVNNLYIFPKNLNFGSKMTTSTLQSKARNLLVKVQFLAKDDGFEAGNSSAILSV